MSRTEAVDAIAVTGNRCPTDQHIRVVCAAYEAGRIAGAAVEVGKKFWGAIGAMRSMGYNLDSPEGKTFINGFMDGLDVRSIHCDPEGIVVEAEKIVRRA